VGIPDDFPIPVTIKHYELKDEYGMYRGDGYQLSKMGEINFPVVYYTSTRGFSLGCHQEYLNHKFSEVHLHNGTGDIIGRQTILWLAINGYRIVYLVRTYHMALILVKNRADDF
jgi:hypothetical protein